MYVGIRMRKRLRYLWHQGGVTGTKQRKEACWYSAKPLFDYNLQQNFQAAKS